MFHFLFFLLLIGLVILFTVIFGVFGFLRMLFRGPRKTDQGFYGRRNSDGVFGKRDSFGRKEGFGNQGAEDAGAGRFNGNDQRQGKIISDKEGEYVDYEEIK